MNKKLYVGGLPYPVTEDKLQENFWAQGTVESARVIRGLVMNIRIHSGTSVQILTS